MVIGSGPIIIGQAAEFDYAGTQACKSLKEEGVEVVLVNSNPATIMTDEDVADHVYVEPLTIEVIERIIERERPDGIIVTLGGQTGLNLGVDLDKAGILEKYGVSVLGTSIPSIEMAEDRDGFKSLLDRINEPLLLSFAVESIGEAETAANKIGFPVVIRPAYTLGGTGGGIANNFDELRRIVPSGIAASKVNQVLVERSLFGWKEIEYEVIRDGAGNVVTVCNMENIDPMGIHTGDSIVVAPSQTLNDKDYQRLRSASLKIVSELKIEGGCNIQFAYKPSDVVSKKLGSNANYHSEGPMYYVIEVNPRVSRSSALASKATGYPIARVAAKIALGMKLDEIPNSVTGKTTAAFEPALDYCVVKIPRWPFDKFTSGDRTLGTQMKATGEVMAIDRCFEAALQKAVRSLENNRGSLLWEDSDRKNPLMLPDDDRLWSVMSSLRRNESYLDISRKTFIDPWFTFALSRIIKTERRLLNNELTRDLLLESKRMGFSDNQIAALSDLLPDQVRNIRKNLGIVPVYKMVDTCAGEFEAMTPYFYSTYESENEAISVNVKKAIILGSGPIRIGQGIEFDYCSVHAAWALQKLGIKSIMINSNPETVSTDFDTSDRLYFEPLDDEAVMDVLENETILDNEGTKIYPKTMVQFGGQTALNLSQKLGETGFQVYGSSPVVIDLASDRGKFENLATSQGLPLPPGGTANSVTEGLEIANNVGYPVLVRPSYVLGGRAMEIAQNENELKRSLARGLKEVPGRPILIDRYLIGIEVEVDAICDGTDVLIPGIIQHIERAGVHSGDSMAVYPPVSLSDSEINRLIEYTNIIGKSFGIIGMMNIQFVITGSGNYRSIRSYKHSSDRSHLESKIHIIEVNPRASRTIPFLSKVTGVPIIQIATSVMNGKKLTDLPYGLGLSPKTNIFAVKAPVFSMSKLIGVDTFLGPEMKSTGEVMGIDKDINGAINKALIASGLGIKSGGSVLLSIADNDKRDAVPLVKDLNRFGHKLFSTTGTAKIIRELGVDVTVVEKRLSGGKSRTVIDVVKDGDVDMVVNTVTGDRTVMQDGFYIRRIATEMNIPCFTSIETARCAIESEYFAETKGNYNIMTLSEYLYGVKRTV
jgi:carbamoyl-phosphate synthase large subunit